MSALEAAHGQKPGWDYSIFGRTHGLNCNYVNDIIRDETGFFWIATDKGLYRFDGANFLTIPVRREKPGNIRRLRLLGDWLYVMYYEDTPTDRLHIQNLGYEPFIHGRINDIVSLDSVTQVVFQSSGRLLRIRNGLVDKTLVTDSSYDGVLSVWNGHIFLQVLARKMYCVKPSSFVIEREYEIPGYAFVRGGFQQNPEMLVVNMANAVYFVNKRLELRPFVGIPESDFQKSHGLIYSSDRLQYYIRTDKELVIRTAGISEGIVFPRKGINELRTIHLVDSSNLLLGTNGSIIHFRNKPSAIVNFNADDTLAEKSIRVRRNILPVTGPDEVILCGFPGIMRWSGKSLERAQALKGYYFSDATRLGSRIYGSSEGKDLFWFDRVTGESGTVVHPDLRETDQIIAIQADTVTNSLLMAGRDALFRLYPDQNRLIRETELEGITVTQIVRSSAGDWWLCTNSGLLQLDSGLRTIRRFSAERGNPRLSNDRISAWMEYSPGRFWVGHEKGAELIDLSQNAVIDRIPESAMADSRIASILKDSLGRVWFSTFDGIVLYESRTGLHIRLSEKSNLINKEYNKRSAARLPDGRLMFGGIAGYDIIDPYAIRFARQNDSGRISAVEWFAEDGSVSKTVINGLEDGIHFDTEKEYIRIHISIQELLETSYSGFQFRFSNGSWKDLDGRYYLDIYKLKPGRYELEFRGFDRNGALISFTPVALYADVPFYKSVVFIILVLSSLIVSLLVIIFIIRHNQVREFRLKESIAMDLHDEVGTTLTRALMVSKSSGMDKKEEKLQDYLSDALFSLRTYIRTMNKARLGVSRVVADLQDVLHAALEYTSVKYTFGSVIHQETDYPASMCRDIKLTVFELLNNVLKHAHATQIDLSVIASSDRFEIDFRDNGKITSLDQLTRKGSGLSNIEKRVARYDGAVHWSIASGGIGLQVLLTFKNKS